MPRRRWSLPLRVRGRESQGANVAGDTEPVITGLAYGEATPFSALDAGEYDFEVRPAGADAASEAIYSTGPLTLSDGDRITAVAAGRIDSTASADEFRVIPIAESFDAPGADSIIVRISSTARHLRRASPRRS